MFPDATNSNQKPSADLKRGRRTEKNQDIALYEKAEQRGVTSSGEVELWNEMRWPVCSTPLSQHITKFFFFFLHSGLKLAAVAGIRIALISEIMGREFWEQTQKTVIKSKDLYTDVIATIGSPCAGHACHCRAVSTVNL